MRNTLLAIIVAMLPASVAAADQPGSRTLSNSANSGKHLPLKKSPGAVNSCAAYGAGFVKVEGTDTCVRTGGNVDLGAGSSGRR